jgi:hypothetical protein
MLTASSKEALNRDLERYIQLTEAGDFEQVMDYIYPGLYKLVPRQMLLDKFKEAFEGSDMSDYTDGFFVSDVSKPVEVEGMVFYKVKYVINLKAAAHSSLVQRIIAGEEINYDEVDNEQEFMLQVMEAVYGSGNVKYDANEACFRIQQMNEMLAVYENGFDTWKFIKYSSGPMYKRIFPPKVVKKLAAYFFIMD